MNKIWVILISIILTSIAFANPNNYIGIDEDGNIYELNHGASSGSLNIDEMQHYETYSTQRTDIIYMHMETQAELDAVAFQSVQYIIPDVLYPAVANIMMDGSTALSAVTTGPNSSTVASSKYGTVQSDGRMYYYTDIKGSKPIKDPRIGAHF